MNYEEKLKERVEKREAIQECLETVLGQVDREISLQEKIKLLPSSISGEIVQIFQEYLGKMMINFDRGENLIPHRFLNALDASPELVDLARDRYLWCDDTPDTPSTIGSANQTTGPRTWCRCWTASRTRS